MFRKLLLLAVSILAYCAPNWGIPGSPPHPKAVTIYNQANKLFHSSNPTTATDEKALKLFGQVISILEINNYTRDTLLFHSYLKKGILLEVKNQYEEARQAYLQAIRIKKNIPILKESALFSVYLYTGSTYYHMNNFDSAQVYFEKAELLILQFPRVPEKERLYNSLGALYYERGNFRQSKNYFNKAIDITINYNPTDIASIINFKNNLAATLVKLGSYKEALEIYHSIANRRVFSNAIYQNMGSAYRGIGDYQKALLYFNKVDKKKVPAVQNEIAYAFIQLKKFDSAEYYLKRVLVNYLAVNNNLNYLDIGINHLYKGELLLLQERVPEALFSLHRSILYLSSNFTNKDYYANPTEFAGTFASFKLFDAISKKAITFEKLYKATRSEKYLLAALSTYESVITLLWYIERSFDTDDARLFLKKNSQTVYKQAMNTSLALFNLKGDRQYLEKAFLISEKTKASVLAANISENSIKKIQGVSARHLREEKNIRFNIAKLNMSSDRVLDSLHLDSIARRKAYFEIRLSSLLKEYEKNSDYYRLKYQEDSRSIKELQRNITSEQAVISFFAVDSTIHSFVVTRSSFHHIPMHSFDQIEKKIIEFNQVLRTVETGRRYKGSKLSAELYSYFIKPLEDIIGEKPEWIIVPDGVLHYLPFEALQASSEGPLLLETHTLSYLFSSHFLQNQKSNKEIQADYKVLSFAPFDAKGIYAKADDMIMDELPASRKEIAGLPGKDFYGNQATKKNFYTESNRYPVIHLATHAVANNINPSRSFIAFFPEKGTTEDFLYLDELYGLDLDSTSLVIMSACETGDGQLIGNEGIMSLSRGFMYAGCPSMLTSLWKANDGATATITSNFHHYLRKGYKKSKALQKAKLDYIQSNTLYKTPNYWAHLVLIGDSCVLVNNKIELKLFLISTALLVLLLSWPAIKKRELWDLLRKLVINEINDWKEKIKKVDAFIG